MVFSSPIRDSNFVLTEVTSGLIFFYKLQGSGFFSSDYMIYMSTRGSVSSPEHASNLKDVIML